MSLPLEETKTTELTSNKGQEERRRHRETPSSWALLPLALVWLHRPVKALVDFGDFDLGSCLLPHKSADQHS